MLQYFSQERTIEDNIYTPEDFLFRWKKLERVLAKEGVDGLLLATGLDAKDSVYSAYLFNWLFLGLSGKSITINKYLDPIYSEMIVIISAQGSRIFITPEAKQNLQNLIYYIPNCKVFCPTEKEYNNKELLDTLKIANFYEMVFELQKIGVFLGQNQDVKLIEKWPLIQSYALEPVGRTFFTLKHQSVNLYSKITPLFRNLDKHSLKNLVNRTAYAMEGHVKGSLMQIQLKEGEQRRNISESLIQQSLQEAVDIEIFESGSLGSKGLVRVLFGDRTQSGETSSNEATIESTNANHLTVQHYDPYTKMKLWRTYFLNSSTKSYPLAELKQIEEEESFLKKNIYRFRHIPNKCFTDQNCLLNLYISLVQSTLESVSAVSKDYRNLNSQFISNFIFGRLSQTAQEIYGTDKLKIGDLITEIESFDSFGEPRPIDFKDSISFKLTSTFYVLKIKLNNIVSPQTNKNLGALIFSQSFLIQEGCYLLLTKRTPYFDFWECSHKNSLLGKLNPNFEFEQLGKPLTQEGFRNRIFIPCEKLSQSHLNIPYLDVKYFFHEKALRIYSDKIGWKVLFYKDMSDITMINKIPGEWVLMKLEKPFLFDGIENNVLGIQFRGKPFEYLMKLNKRKQDPLQITYIEEVPPMISQNWYFTSEILRRPIKEGQVLHQHQILVNDFLWSFIESKQMMIINQMKDLKIASFRNAYQAKLERKKQERALSSEKHSLLLVVGSYGSGKFKLAQNLKKFGPNEIKTTIFNVSAQNLYKKLSEDTFVQMIEEFTNDNEIAIGTLIITIVPSWLSIHSLLPFIVDKFQITSVLTKVNTSNFFATKNSCLVENVLSYCVPGFTQNIVVDTYVEDESVINSVMKIVGVFNKEARIARSSNCLLTTGQCQDILRNNNYTTGYQSFLRAKYGILLNFQQISDLSLNFIEFKLPIYDMPLIKNLTKSEGYLIDRKAILKEIEHKKREAENSKDDLMMGLYFLEEVMTIVRRRHKVPQIRSIKALCRARKPDSEKDQQGYFEVNWANQQYRCIEIDKSKISQRTLGFSILCRRFDEIQTIKFIENLSYKTKLFGEPKQMKTIDSLTEQEIKEIEQDAIVNNKCFENGEYFDGYVLRNAQGFSIDNHPYLDKAVQSAINEWNATVSNHNAELRAKWNHYKESFVEE